MIARMGEALRRQEAKEAGVVEMALPAQAKAQAPDAPEVFPLDNTRAGVWGVVPMVGMVCPEKHRLLSDPDANTAVAAQGALSVVADCPACRKRYRFDFPKGRAGAPPGMERTEAGLIVPAGRG